MSCGHHTPACHKVLAVTPCRASHTPAHAVLCREESIKVWNARQQFEEAGVRLVCVLHEWIDREVDAFRPEYWGE